MTQHKGKKKICRTAGVATFALAACILTGSSVPSVQAASVSKGKTEVNLGVTELTETNVSFEVPLYYVMCVSTDANGKATVVLPEEDYSIVNKSPTVTGQAVAVTEIKVTGVTGGNWSLAGSAAELGTSPTEQKIHMTVGEMALPALAKGSAETKTVETNASQNSFYRNNKYTRLEPYDGNTPEKSTVVIPVSAQVSPDYQVTANRKTVAQFRLSYTVSPLNKNGDVMKAKVIQ